MTLVVELLQSMEDIVFAKDLDGKYIAGNGTWSLLLSKSASELIGLSDLDLFPADLAADFRRNDLTMLASGESKTNEECV